MKQKRKTIILAGAIIILILLAVFLTYYFLTRRQPGQFNPVSPTTTLENVVSSNISTSTPYQPDWSSNNRHPVELKLMTDKEKDQFNLSLKANPSRIQILKRDAAGKITDYRLIRDDSDLIRYQLR
jgi:regulatory protein YycI of two-component signal transduction system YycFG